MTNEQNRAFGFVETRWAEIKNELSEINPEFTAIVNQLNPDFPLYISTLPYGCLHNDGKSVYVYDKHYGAIPLAQKSLNIHSNLTSQNSPTPLGMLLDKQSEVYSEPELLKSTHIRGILNPGDLHPLNFWLDQAEENKLYPSQFLSTSSGLRSVFFLANIHNEKRHQNLKTKLKIRSKFPRSSSEQWPVFRDIAHSLKSPWSSSMLYFSNEWIDAIDNNPDWLPLKAHIQSHAWKFYQYAFNEATFDSAFSTFGRDNYMTADAYTTETLKRLYKIGMGVYPAFEPAVDETGLPLSIIQQAYLNHYDLKDYIPTLLKPSYFNYQNQNYPLYYSTQYTGSYLFSPAINDTQTFISTLRHLENMMVHLNEYFLSPESQCEKTLIGEVVKHVEYKYFHGFKDDFLRISDSPDIPESDPRFGDIGQLPLSGDEVFPYRAKFLHGCIRIQRVNNTHSDTEV